MNQWTWGLLLSMCRPMGLHDGVVGLVGVVPYNEGLHAFGISNPSLSDVALTGLWRWFLGYLDD